MEKRRLSFWKIWNMSFKFFRIQISFALKNVNTTKILQIFGVDVNKLSLFLIKTPSLRLIVQLVKSYHSENTWCLFGIRKHYFLASTILTYIGLVLMLQVKFFKAFLPELWFETSLLMIVGVSFLIAKSLVFKVKEDEVIHL
jgi:maltose/moltooligosaccharide transporter